MSLDINTAPTVTKREDEGIPVALTDAAGNPAGATVVLAGTYSRRYREAQDKNKRWWRKHLRQQVADEEIEQQAIELTAACVISWTGFVQDGKEYPCTKANVVHVLASMPWVRDQIEQAVTDHERFFSTESAT